jgi:hypothetical protein
MNFDSNEAGAAFGNPLATRKAVNQALGKKYNVGATSKAGGGGGRGSGKAELEDQAKRQAAQVKPQAAPPKPSETAKPKEQPKKGFTPEGGVHRFPTDYASYFMLLRFAPYDRNTVFSDASKDHDLFIALPLPANLGEAFGVNVGKQAFGAFAKEIGEVVNNTINNRQSGQDLQKSMSSAVADRIKNARESGTITNILASRLAGGFGESAAAGVDMLLGTTPNPNLAVNFQGVPLRTYGFTWRFAPRSVAESQELLFITTKLKQRMLPGKKEFILTYPDHCEISVHSPGELIRQLIKFKTSFLTDVRINYAPSGVPSFFAGTTMPTEMELSLTFQETKIFTREDFDTTIQLQSAPPPI